MQNLELKKANKYVEAFMVKSITIVAITAFQIYNIFNV
ncbi:hypothetical protein HMPREF0581_1523 [Mogibacterium timidum ATCC 33093]|uniref:Uncharacterized protein n=1 Tax=Mogibacterium timidum ATCC 33093 TaxID=1401079 RepID=X8IQ25_9FIRM|nr:hypothetical protein HMPREF0581_1523 [Mogibacterium timidum ATCC 33093]